MKRCLTVVPATLSLGAVLLLGWGCATMPPNHSPQDPFIPDNAGPPPQQNFRPQYPPPQFDRGFQPDPRFQPTQPYPYRSAPPRGTPTPLRAPTQPRSPMPLKEPVENPTSPADDPPPRTFSEPPPDTRFAPPRRSSPNTAPPFRPQPQRTDKLPSSPPRRTTPQAPPQQPPRRQPAPTVPESSDGPELLSPEDMPTASRTSLPKFAAKDAIELIVAAPDRRPVGSGAPFQLTIRNSGEDTLRNVNIICEFDDALSFPGSDRKSVTHKIPKIEGSDARDSLLTLVSDRPGVHECRFEVEIGGKIVSAKSVAVEFVSRQLEWQLHGPAERTVGSRAEFNIPLINITRRPLKNLVVKVDLDSALTVREMTQGGKLGDRSVTWTINELAANEGMLLQLEVECQEPTTQACLSVTVSGDDVPADDAEACLAVKPIAGLLDVRVQDVTDPVAAGEEVELVISIENRGLQPARSLAVSCRWPEGFEFVSADVVKAGRTSAVKADQRNQSASLPTVSRLDADQKLIYHVKLTAGSAGAHQLTVSVTESAGTTPHEVIEPIMVHR